MGHVDHGKTTLLDAIRGTNVQAGETGGITQNTSAYQIEYKGHKITFLDTPGHEAFSSMRSRGAKVTDIVLLVVAVDDGVQPQTKESIKFALEEKVPILIAVNKIDMPGKKSQKIKQELTTAGLVLEEYGGDVMLAEVSALKRTGIDELLDRVLLIAEMQEFKKDEVIGMKGRLFVLESKLSQSQGAVALCLVKGGEIDKNNYVVCDGEVKRIRTLLDHNQKNVEVAVQGDPVWIIGSDKVLPTGKILEVYATEKEGQKAVKRINEKADEPSIIEAITSTPEIPSIPEIENNLELLSQMITTSRKTEEIKFLNVIVKADTQGTLEAVIESLKDLNDDFVQVKIILQGTGKITEKDILAAKNSKGIVIGFQVEMDRHTEVIARKEKVLVRVYQIIYDLIDELGEAMNSLIEPEFNDVEVSRAKVKKVFVLTNKKIVAGCLAIKGNIVRGYKVHLERAGEKIGESKIVSLRKLKEEVKEITKGQECGILLEPSLDVQEDDEIVCVKTERV
jgi:translation initiation factor IF-2